MQCMDNSKLNAWLSNKNKSKVAIYIFGRMNPPTRGHELMIQRVKNMAARHDMTPYVFVSRTQNMRNNPLSHNHKIKILQTMFPNIANRIINHRNIFSSAKFIRNSNFNHVILVAGSNRAPQYAKFPGMKTKNGMPYPIHGFYPFGSERIKVNTFENFLRLPNNNKTKAYSGTLARTVARSSLLENRKVAQLREILSSKLSDNNIRQIIRSIPIPIKRRRNNAENVANNAAPQRRVVSVRRKKNVLKVLTSTIL